MRIALTTPSSMAHQNCVTGKKHATTPQLTMLQAFCTIASFMTLIWPDSAPTTKQWRYKVLCAVNENYSLDPVGVLQRPCTQRRLGRSWRGMVDPTISISCAASSRPQPRLLTKLCTSVSMALSAACASVTLGALKPSSAAWIRC